MDIKNKMTNGYIILHKGFIENSFLGKCYANIMLC